MACFQPRTRMSAPTEVTVMYRVYRARQSGLAPLIVLLGLAPFASASPLLTYPATTSGTSGSGIRPGGPSTGSGMVWISGSSSPVMSLAMPGRGAAAVNSSTAAQSGRSGSDSETVKAVSSGSATRSSDFSSGSVDSLSSVSNESVSATASVPHASNSQANVGGALSVADARGSSSGGRSAVLAARSADAADHTERSRIISTQTSPAFAPSSGAGSTAGASGVGSPFVASCGASPTSSNGTGTSGGL